MCLPIHGKSCLPSWPCATCSHWWMPARRRGYLPQKACAVCGRSFSWRPAPQTWASRPLAQRG
ncbi:DUF2256 domain-containing protein [Halopseudomonas maritima]|uniref:DUF2256 domain-containing protein n=1 Tax=Halopseudomonas maritima TaxID=2918528 RepID=UPI0037BEA0AA|nr:DUF2256 domain-containing protein [Halopseudomonas maritima]